MVLSIRSTFFLIVSCLWARMKRSLHGSAPGQTMPSRCPNFGDGVAPCGPLAVGLVALWRLRNAAHGLVRLGGHRERVRRQVGRRYQLPQDVHTPAAQLRRTQKATQQRVDEAPG